MSNSKPKPIVVISYGNESNAARAVEHWLGQQEQELGMENMFDLDVRPHLTDKILNLVTQQNGTHPATCRAMYAPVSYTHLTLPTIYSV